MTQRGLCFTLVAVLGAACGVGVDDGQAVGVSSFAVNTPKFELPNPPDRDCRTVSARPTASGTVRSAPTVGMLEVAPVGDAVQSMFFESTMEGGETRHGIAEFDVPVSSGRVLSAELRFADSHGWQLQAAPADWHRLTLIPQADGVITADDFVREGTLATTFSTDLNDLYPVEHRFDVTDRVTLGGRLGVLLELDRAPTAGSYGSAFTQFRLDVVVCNAASLPDGQPGEPGDVK